MFDGSMETTNNSSFHLAIFDLPFCPSPVFLFVLFCSFVCVLISHRIQCADST